jgi:hypothetical protein
MNTIMIYLHSNGNYRTSVHVVKDRVLKQDAGDGKMKEISDYL